MAGITDEMRARMTEINANLNSSRVRNSGATYLRFDRKKKKVIEVERLGAIANHSMFPYKSTAMAVEPNEVPAVQEALRKEGLFAEFDKEGRPEITSTKQQDALAKAMGMKTGRDGYGHTDEHGQFQNSGRRRTDEMQEGRSKVQRAIKELEAMPEEVSAGVVDGVLGEYNIFPNEENTG
jgi:hypothetical protein